MKYCVVLQSRRGYTVWYGCYDDTSTAEEVAGLIPVEPGDFLYIREVRVWGLSR